MLKRVCPKCFTRWYSACSTDEALICETCKSEIPKSLETVAENENITTDRF